MTIKALNAPISIMSAEERAKWVTYEEIRDAMGMLAPSRRYLVQLGYYNPKLKSVNVEMRRNGPRLWNRAGVIAWIETKFKAHPDFVAKVRAELLPPPKATKRRGHK